MVKIIFFLSHSLVAVQTRENFAHMMGIKYIQIIQIILLK